MANDPTRAAYDAVAQVYRDGFADELDHKPLDRALLQLVVDAAQGGPVLDLGCGPGHVTDHLATLGADAAGIDLSPEMILIARSDHPLRSFEVGSMTALARPDASCAAVVALYSIIHLDPAGLDAAAAEIARVLRPGGIALVSFHVQDADHEPGARIHHDEFLGQPVDLDATFFAPATVSQALTGAGLAVEATIMREPIAGVEYPSRRCYLLARRP